MTDWRTAKQKELDRERADKKNAEYLDQHDTLSHFITVNDIIQGGFGHLGEAQHWAQEFQTSYGGHQEIRTRRSIQKQINKTDDQIILYGTTWTIS